MKKKNFRGFLAFSMIELLITIIIISLLTSALAPVITRKLTKQSVSVGSSSNITSNCSEAFSSDCTFARMILNVTFALKFVKMANLKIQTTAPVNLAMSLMKTVHFAKNIKAVHFAKMDII